MYILADQHAKGLLAKSLFRDNSGIRLSGMCPVNSSPYQLDVKFSPPVMLLSSLQLVFVIRIVCRFDLIHCTAVPDTITSKVSLDNSV